MKIAIIALGSQGDVQPYIALGKGLIEAGHNVRLLTHENFGTTVQSHGLEFCSMKGNVQAVVESPEMRALLEKGDFIAITRQTAKLSQQAALDWAKDGLAGCIGMDLIIAGVGGLNVGVALAEKLNIPLLQAYVFPFTATRAFPGILFPPLFGKFGGTVNYFSHQLVRQLMWQGFRSADTMARKEVLDLPAAPFFGTYTSSIMQRLPVLYGFSPSVIAPAADWKNTHVTGYWTLEPAANWVAPPALETFLAAGKPPVYIGFGSMSNRDPEKTAQLVLDALAQTGGRAILQSGWNGMSATNLPENVFLLESVPHSWLFDKVTAVVHHGGAGTTAAGLRAGVPSLVIPFFGDQGFWGQHVADLGVGTAPISRQHLTSEKLARGLQNLVTDSSLRARAAELGKKVRAEDGIKNAVQVINQLEL